MLLFYGGVLYTFIWLWFLMFTVMTVYVCHTNFGGQRWFDFEESSLPRFLVAYRCSETLTIPASDSVSGAKFLIQFQSEMFRYESYHTILDPTQHRSTCKCWFHFVTRGFFLLFSRGPANLARPKLSFENWKIRINLIGIKYTWSWQLLWNSKCFDVLHDLLVHYKCVMMCGTQVDLCKP